MAKFKTTLVILFLLVVGVHVAMGQNPFTSGSNAPAKTTVPTITHPLLTKITIWQHALNQKIATLIRQAKIERSLKPLTTLLIIAFGYGVLHAAGPGHGKAVAMSYILSQRQTISGGILFGNLIALSHGLTGAIWVLGLRFALQKGLMGTLESVSRTTQIISFVLIAFLGTGIMVKSLFSWLRKTENRQLIPDPNPPQTSKHLLPTALAVGMVPCPGVVMVMLFCLSMNMIGLGLLLALFMSLGMAATISVVVITALTCKGLSLNALSQKERWAVRAEHTLEFVSGMAMAVLGVFFLAAAV